MSEAKDLLTALAPTFAPEDDVDAPDRLTMDDVRTFLIGHLTRLLDRNPGLLMSLLYRIDVPEPKVKAALTAAPPADLPGVLADLIIERQLEKLRIRRQYGG